MKAENLARVRIAGREDPVLVPITSSDKPAIPESMEKNWGEIIGLLAEVINVPSGLIMRLGQENIEVFLKSKGEANPYERGETAPLMTGLYCETVVGRRERLLVPDARRDPAWSDNPDVKLNMISYLGFPVAWPDGEIFGTICVLDHKENRYEKRYISLLERFRNVIEQDLSLLLVQDDLRRMNLRKDLILREVHHRIKNNFNLLISYLRLKTQGPGDLSSIARDMELRIQALSMLHEKIYKGDLTGVVGLRDYVRDLLDTMVSNLAGREVRLFLDVAGRPMTLETLIPLGMILSELVTNSIRHGFAGCPDPEIKLVIRDRGEGSFFLDYRDNGKGFPEGFDPRSSETLGMSLIRSLSEQLGGNCRFGPGPEAVILIEFRMSLPPA